MASTNTGVAQDSSGEFRARQPSTWVMGDMVLDANYGGILFPSLANPGGVNVVLFLDAFRAAGGRIAVHDPDGRLPTDARSWPA